MSSVAFAVHFCCPIDAPSQVAADVCLTSTTRGNIRSYLPSVLLGGSDCQPEFSITEKTNKCERWQQ